MRIVIDARMMYWTGVGRYTKALLDELQEIDESNEYRVLMRRADWDAWTPTSPNFLKIEANINPYSLAEQVWLPAVIRGLKPDLVHFTAANTPLLWWGPRVVTVHDLTLLDFDTRRRDGWRGRLWQLKRWAFRLVFWNNAKFATMLLTDTDYVHDQLIERLGAPSRRVRTALLAVDPNVAQPEPLERFGQLGRFIFHAGNMYPYKNIESTIRALGLLAKDDADLTLVIAGKRDSFSEKLERLAAELGLGDRVKFVGFVSDGEMISLYRAAALYVNPSLSEGFGLQGLEAMAQGLPVVAARASCLPEVYGAAAEYFDPRDPADQARAMTAVLDDAVLAGTLRSAGHKRIKDFSWKRMAEQTLEAYMSAAKK